MGSGGFERGAPVSQCHDTYEARPAEAAHFPVRAEDIMTPDPIVVEPTATVRDIASVMLHRDIRMVPVVEIGDQLVGVVSESDLLCRAGFPSVRHHGLAAFLEGPPAVQGHDGPTTQGPDWAARSQALTAEEIMTTTVVSCGPEEPVAAIARRMLERDVRTMPVVRDGRLAGVVSRHDVLRLFVRPDSEVRAHVADILSASEWVPGFGLGAEVRDGVVVLTGTASSPLEVAVICSIVRQVAGVVEVVDQTVTEGDLHR